jgi:LAS superfamily LD-carboxypeptidase LdcB
MGINKIKKKSLKILLATILCLIAFSATSRANHRDIPLKEIFSKSLNEPGEAFYFFIPQTANDQNQYTYVYDTKLDRLLFFPKHKGLISKIEDQEIDLEDWPGLLNEFILNSEDSLQLKVIDLNKDWVKFTLDGRHIVLPRKLMVEEAAQKEWEQGNFLPQDYIPDDLVRIHQKWNFHTPEYPKYLRGYVASKIERMLQNAEEQGIHIRVFSAYRSYEKQRYLYLRAISRSGRNQNKVAKPGHSEHQLGTTVDLCGLDPKTVLDPNFNRTKEGRWLRENAPKFGFYQSYTRENQHLTGYIPEPWHYRFYGEKRDLPYANWHL